MKEWKSFEFSSATVSETAHSFVLVFFSRHFSGDQPYKERSAQREKGTLLRVKYYCGVVLLLSLYVSVCILQHLMCVVHCMLQHLMCVVYCILQHKMCVVYCILQQIMCVEHNRRSESLRLLRSKSVFQLHHMYRVCGSTSTTLWLNIQSAFHLDRL